MHFSLKKKKTCLCLRRKVFKFCRNLLKNKYDFYERTTFEFLYFYKMLLSFSSNRLNTLEKNTFLKVIYNKDNSKNHFKNKKRCLEAKRDINFYRDLRKYKTTLSRNSF